MAETTGFDFLILGSGSTAFAAALRAQELGKTSVMIESRKIGGTCVNRGCLPSKNLIEAARLVHEAEHPRYPGLASASLGLNFRELVEQKNEVVRGYLHKKYESLLGGHFNIRPGHGRFVDPNTVEVEGVRVSGEKILIASGSRPVVPQIDGLEDVPYLTSDLLTTDEPMELKELPESLLIVGGGYVALELGQMFKRFGVDVTILERSPEILSYGYEPEVGPGVRDVLVNEGLRIVLDAHVQRLRPEGTGVVATVAVGGSGIIEFKASRLLLATGRRPNTDEIGIEKTGVKLTNTGHPVVDEFLRTSAAHIFAAGDVIGTVVESRMATPVGSQDGGIAAHNALSDEQLRPVGHRVIPRAIFIDPPLALVGMTEAQAVAAGHLCWCNTVPMSLVPRAGAIRDTRGFIKMVADAETDEVLGVTMLGSGAAEVIHEAAMALRFRATLHDFIALLHVYPTMAEALKIVAISRYKDPAKLSCCAE
jgi:mercuric reductase